MEEVSEKKISPFMKYYETHKEICHARCRPYKATYREKNKEKINDYGKSYYQLNKEKILERKRQERLNQSLLKPTPEKGDISPAQIIPV